MTATARRAANPRRNAATPPDSAKDISHDPDQL
jgi:hypothetical protein